MIAAMKQTILFLMLICLTGLLPVRAQRHTATRWDDGRTLTVEYQITPRQPGSDYAYVVTPMLCSSKGDTIEIKPTVWRGKRNVKKLLRERFFNDIETQLPPYIDAADTTTRSFTVTFDLQRYPWLTEGPIHLSFLNDVEGCCQVEQDEVDAPPFVYDVFTPEIVQVEDRTGKMEYVRTNEMGYFVHFPLNRATLRRDFRQNAATLDSIVAITRRTLADAGAEVKRIQIIGQASPDGPVKRNLWLGEHRAKALRDYICRQIDAPDSLFIIVNGGEGWTEFRQQIALSQMPERDTLLAIIDGEPDVDKRERRIKRLYGGKTYDYLRDHVLADQRNSGYMHIHYEYLPDEGAPVINRAIELIRNGQHAEGLKLLSTVEHDDRSLNAIGNAYYMAGEKEKAIAVLTRAKAKGDKQAEANLKQIRLLESRKQELMHEVQKLNQKKQ